MIKNDIGKLLFPEKNLPAWLYMQFALLHIKLTTRNLHARRGIILKVIWGRTRVENKKMKIRRPHKNATTVILLESPGDKEFQYTRMYSSLVSICSICLVRLFYEQQRVHIHMYTLTRSSPWERILKCGKNKQTNTTRADEIVRRGGAEKWKQRLGFETYNKVACTLGLESLYGNVIN